MRFHEIVKSIAILIFMVCIINIGELIKTEPDLFKYTDKIYYILESEYIEDNEEEYIYVRKAVRGIYKDIMKSRLDTVTKEKVLYAIEDAESSRYFIDYKDILKSRLNKIENSIIDNTRKGEIDYNMN